MPQINLLDYAIVSRGRLVEAQQIVLAEPGDEVAIAGPIHICVRLQAANETVDQHQQPTLRYHDVYTYNFMIPAGHTWRYRADEVLSQLRLGTNKGGQVVICPSSPTTQPKPVKTVADLPCDFAVGNIADSSQFFPAGCEPCPPDAKVALPPGTQPTLITPPAPGGCVRTRFFNGMFITREDLETEQRFFRMKNKLQNQTFGEGVVWGLDVSCHGNAICVHPGYGIDCCGNALVVSTPYKVDVESLIRDPAAFTYLVPGKSATALACDEEGVSAVDTMTGVRPTERRMHLLLECIECPEESRPVHGDPCSPEVTDCEMSRIRETVRLRLVPPRDYDPTGCIDSFLAEIEKLKVAEEVSSAAAGEEGVNPEELLNAIPFSVEIAIKHLNGTESTHMLRPDTHAHRELPPPSFLIVPVGDSAELHVRTDPDWYFTSGSVVDEGGVETNLDSASNSIVASRTLTLPPNTTHTQAFTIRNWCATRSQEEDRSIIGTTEISITSEQGVGGIAALPHTLRLKVQPTQPELKVVGVTPYPCTGDACGDDPLGGLFNLLPPFLHKDPRGTGQGIDWKILMLAATYGWLASEMVRNKVGTPQQVASQRLQTAAQIYQSALQLLCGKRPDAETARRITEELRCLLQCWCRSFIYPGPACHEDPIGVIIGCVRISGGTIRDLDPLGGRRWVVTYPLLTYWGHQFGIAPLDVTLSRVFSLICCIGELPPPVLADRQEVTGQIALRRVEPAGNAYLLRGTPEETAAELRLARINVEREREVRLDEFISHLVTGLRTTPGAGTGRFEVVSLAGTPDIRLAVPLEVAHTPRIDRVAEVARAALPSETVRAKLRPLLRPLVGDVHRALLMQVSIGDLDEHPLGEQLKAAGLSTAGDVLTREPEELQVTLGAGDPGRAKLFSKLYQQSERHAEAVGKAVVESVAAVVEERDISTREELLDAEALVLFTDRLANRLSRGRQVLISRELLEAVVHNSLAAGRRS